MSNKKKRLNDKEIRSKKKNAVLKNQKSSKLPLIIAVLCALMAAVALGTYFNSSRDVNTEVQAAVAPQTSSTSISFDVAQFNGGKAKFYEYADGKGNTIKYFILKSSDGIIRAAFDACDVCWRAGKGYVQDGDQMVCRNCGRRFDSVRINEIKGGCNPAPLKRQVDGSRLIIQKKDILEGVGYFNFNGKA